MSEQNEAISDDLSTWSVDDEDQLQPEDTLISDGVADVLDRGFSPNDTDRYSRAFGTTGAEQAGYETIEQRILQEVPDPVTAYGAPENEAGDVALIGGDDPDAIPADDDWIGDAEVGAARAGRLVMDDTPGHDSEWGRDVGIDGAGAAAEEAALHIVVAPQE